MTRSPRRPEKTEYAEYYDRYIQLVPEGDVVEFLRSQAMLIIELLEGVAPAAADFRYAPGKWSLKEVLGHIIDGEWVFTSRALWIARGDTSPLPGMDQDSFMAGANFSARTISSLLEEFRHLRFANTVLFDSFDSSVLGRRGVASGNPFSVRALLYVIGGHAAHHVNVLREKYLGRSL
jgi:hypothetical protein